MKRILVIITAVVSTIYLINPTAGVFELLPDNIPFIGNVDEGLAAYLLFSSIEYLRGKPLSLFKKN